MERADFLQDTLASEKIPSFAKQESRNNGKLARAKRGIIFSRRPISIVGNRKRGMAKANSGETRKSRKWRSKLRGQPCRRVLSRRRNKRECLRVLRTCHASGFANSCPVSHLSTSGRKRGRRSYIHAYIEKNRRFGRRQFVFLAARSAERRGIP